MLLQLLLTWVGLLTLDYLYEKTRLMRARALISSCVTADDVLQKPILVTIQDMLVCLNKDVTSTLLSLIYFITD